MLVIRSKCYIYLYKSLIRLKLFTLYEMITLLLMTIIASSDMFSGALAYCHLKVVFFVTMEILMPELSYICAGYNNAIHDC